MEIIGMSTFIKHIFLPIAFCAILLSACKSENERFAETYRKILINRELHSDSITARREMLKILDAEGYDLESFKTTYMDYSREKPEEFINMLDTMRRSVTQEIIKQKAQRK